MFLALLGEFEVQAQDRPTFRSSAHLVQVMVSVSNGGGAVDDLGPSEFQITDEGTNQPIAFFQPPVSGSGHSLAGPANPESDTISLAERPLGNEANEGLHAKHHLFIVLEPMHMEHRQRTIRAVSRFVRESETAASYSIALVDGPRLIQHFSSDKQRTLRALSQMAAQQYTPARTIALNNWLGPTLSVLQELARTPGHKSMVLFIDFDVPTVHALWPELALRFNIVLYPVDARGLLPVVPFGDASAEHQLGPGASGLASGGAWAGPLIAADLMSRTSELGQQALLLRSVEEATGGRRLVNDNDLGKIFVLVEENSRGMYVLGYYLSESVMDGRFHRVGIRVTRPGLTVRTKEGYFAPKS